MMKRYLSLSALLVLGTSFLHAQVEIIDAPPGFLEEEQLDAQTTRSTLHSMINAYQHADQEKKREMQENLLRLALQDALVSGNLTHLRTIFADGSLGVKLLNTIRFPDADGNNTLDLFNAHISDPMVVGFLVSQLGENSVLYQEHWRTYNTPAIIIARRGSLGDLRTFLMHSPDSIQEEDPADRGLLWHTCDALNDGQDPVMCLHKVRYLVEAGARIPRAQIHQLNNAKIFRSIMRELLRASMPAK